MPALLDPQLMAGLRRWLATVNPVGLRGLRASIRGYKRLAQRGASAVIADLSGQTARRPSQLAAQQTPPRC